MSGLTRRSVLAMSSAAVACGASWAEAGGAHYLSAAKTGGGAHRLTGLTQSCSVAFDIALPDRGHAAAAHPNRAEAVAFARRPGRFAMVLDCVGGQVRQRLTPPEGRHFYGHGAFTADGSVLLTSENDFEVGQGRIGLWSANESYRRIGEVSSGGVGPHDIVRLPGGGFAVANGGIRTHPATGRDKLNLPTMRPNLTYLDDRFDVIDIIEPEAGLHQNSIRHLAVRPDGTVAVAMQWQGDLYEAPPLLALHSGSGPLVYPKDTAGLWRRMNGYAGSVSFNGAGDLVAVTSPRGGVVLGFGMAGDPVFEHRLADVCGLAASGAGFLVSSGMGKFLHMDGAGTKVMAQHPVSWDNHIVPIH